MTYNLNDPWRQELVERLSNGESMSKICSEDHMPDRNTVMSWRRKDDDFYAECARAMELAGEKSADDQQEIVEKTIRGEIPSDVARVAISAMQWRASKLAPKQFGEKMTVENTGQPLLIMRDFSGKAKRGETADDDTA